ncbi:TIM21-domain-containing protein [Lasiosphaeria hispida]|uniref:Mitochondrial import inner membrane translocase subunit Tim21 n=1 Tax=Lasiosphaeria hispida TaxID=260671 RepID=A0AAJ0MEK0_9PEZI|nr:TIM21-domain-containing protein [Lasiosphaeria hispida]
MNRLASSGRRALCPVTTTTNALVASSSLSQPHLFSTSLPLALARLSRQYATQQQQQNQPKQPKANRRAVTPFNDDGRIPWRQLSATERVGRAAQQSFNFGVVIVGMLLTGGVGYILYTEVFSPDSATAYYNRAVDRIKKDPRCLELLGDAKKITAYGEPSSSRWRTARPIAHDTSKDRYGNDHIKVHFNIRGPKASGRVAMHMVRHAGQEDYEYQYFFVDVKGQQRIYMENADTSATKDGEQKPFRLFGIKWT